MSSLSDFFIRHAKGGIILLAFLAVLVGKTALFPRISAVLAAPASAGGPLDARFFYTPQQAKAIIAAYNAEGRRIYMVSELTLDILFPIAYTLFLALSISWLFQRTFDRSGSMQRLNLVPVGAWFFDLLENIGVVIMLAMFPSFSLLVGSLTSSFTVIKWSFALLSILLLLFGVVAYLLRRVRG